MSVSFNGFGEKVLTFLSEEKITAGYPVKVADSCIVAACEEGDSFCGIALESDGEYTCVQLSGAVTLPYSGEDAPEAGYVFLSADGDGGVAADEDGREYLVLSVDTTGNEVTFII